MDLALRALPAFLGGLWSTILYCVVSFPLALLLGLILALMYSSQFIWLRGPARFFIEIMRGTPLIAQLFIIYYALGALVAGVTIGPVKLVDVINPWTAGVTALALNYAAYEAEIFRAGFLSVDRGQSEAALSLGLNGWQTFFRVVLPQAIPFTIPPFVNDFIYMLKDSAIVSVIAGSDLTAILNFWVFRNSSNPIPLYVLAIGLYLLLSLPTSYVAKFFERRLRAAL